MDEYTSLPKIVSGFNYFSERSEQNLHNPNHSTHYSIGPAYWFRLKQKRIEFNPAILFDYSSSEYPITNSNKNSFSCSLITS